MSAAGCTRSANRQQRNPAAAAAVRAPYEIDPADAQRKALKDIAFELGFTKSVGDTAADAIDEVGKCVAGKSGVPWGRVQTAAAGVALIAA
ncbi:hypothetical protein QGN32_23135 [Mycolicibacterium sp. ND9-15]|uniref:hypothetical protein n=1 Tax=Mycolicibacterium sp. ND9-15 TaxID=3042320 RepID=UPI002DD923C2|nr:hypothetical protein [Mycolicibacterium sp. ND9-15]WSE56192.1 hypothetical protein QGN32_23135 [Mycolicibacterium sp. ND9-15]